MTLRRVVGRCYFCHVHAYVGDYLVITDAGICVCRDEPGCLRRREWQAAFDQLLAVARERRAA